MDRLLDKSGGVQQGRIFQTRWKFPTHLGHQPAHFFRNAQCIGARQCVDIHLCGVLAAETGESCEFLLTQFDLRDIADAHYRCGLVDFIDGG